jgi:hypothetical protein
MKVIIEKNIKLLQEKMRKSNRIMWCTGERVTKKTKRTKTTERGRSLAQTSDTRVNLIETIVDEGEEGKGKWGFAQCKLGTVPYKGPSSHTITSKFF